MTMPRRRSALLVVASLLAIAAATLVSLPAQAEAVAQTSVWCLLCGSLGAVDVILNVALFCPLGGALRLHGCRLRSIVGLSLAVSLTLELLQGGIPGRDPTISDVLTNTVGGLLGSWAVTWWPHFIHPRPRTAAALAAAWAALWLGQTAGVAWLLQPSLPRSWYWGQLAPDLRQFEQFYGTVRSASAGTLGIYIGRLARSPEIRQALLEGAPLRGTTTRGTRTPGLAPIVSIFDQQQREIALLGRWGNDLVYRFRTRTFDFRLRPPAIGFANALAGGADEMVDLSGRYDPDSAAFVVALRGDTGEPVQRRLALDAQWGWSLLLPFPYAHGPEAAWWTGLWLLVWMVVLGYWSWAYHPAAVLAAGVVAALGLGPLPALLGLTPAAGYEWVVAASGLTTGAALAIRRGRGAPLLRRTA
jgi:hypothetical protein